MSTEWNPLMDNRHAEQFLSQPRDQQWVELHQELLAENRTLRDELARLQRHNSILEQRLRRIGDAVVEGRVVDGQ